MIPAAIHDTEGTLVDADRPRHLTTLGLSPQTERRQPGIGCLAERTADHFPVHDTVGLFARLFPYAHYALEFAPHQPLPDGMWMQVGSEALTLRPTLDVDGTNGEATSEASII